MSVEVLLKLGADLVAGDVIFFDEVERMHHLLAKGGPDGHVLTPKGEEMLAAQAQEEPAAEAAPEPAKRSRKARAAVETNEEAALPLAE